MSSEGLKFDSRGVGEFGRIVDDNASKWRFAPTLLDETTISNRPIVFVMMDMNSLNLEVSTCYLEHVVAMTTRSFTYLICCDGSSVRVCDRKLWMSK